MDWAQAVDAHGATERVPALLDQVAREETSEAWEELWDRLCLHGETVSPASFTALPTLASLAPASAPALELAGAIVRGTMQHRDGEALLAGCPDAIAQLRELVDRQLQTSPADYNRIFGDLLALEGQYHWSAALGDFTDDFYTVSCPHCGAEVTIAIGDYGNYSAIRDWDLGDIAHLRGADDTTRRGHRPWVGPAGRGSDRAPTCPWSASAHASRTASWSSGPRWQHERHDHGA